MSVALIIPARNEVASLPALISRIPSWVDEIIVVDNGSNDGTGDIAKGLGCQVIYEPQIGYGAAVWAGSQAANSDILAFASADGSDPVEALGELISPLKSDEARFVFAARVPEPGSMGWIQRAGNKLASRLIAMRWGVSFGDLGPFRALHRDTLISLKMKDRGFGWTLEMQAKIASRGYRWRKIALPYFRRKTGNSKISGTFKGTFMAGCTIVWTFVILALKRHL